MDQDKAFNQSQLTAICNALGDTEKGLTGREIAHLLASCKIVDTDPTLTKRHRVFNALANDQNKRGDRTGILAFIRKSMKPERFLRDSERFEPLRILLNEALLFNGLIIDATGTLKKTTQATTIPEAQKRAQELKASLTRRGVHPDVLVFCSAELVEENYFHAVLEAVKSVRYKLNEKSGLDGDGSNLVDSIFSGERPILAINSLSNQDEKSEQRGFAHLLKGTFGMFRNPTAHSARISWDMSKEDAEDLFSLLSLIHRRIDTSRRL